MSLFDRTEKKQPHPSTEGSLAQRLEVFLTKLTEKAVELYDAVKKSAQTVADEDRDPFKRSFLQFKSGMLAQFNAILQKGSQTFHQEVMPKARGREALSLPVVFNAWHSRLLNMMVTAFDGVQERDLEKAYAEAMDAYNDIKNKFRCRQCGSPLEIDRFYFLATYISCPSCRTQNTFDPGSKAKMVEHLARPLAELRSGVFRKAYEQERKEKGAAAAFGHYEQYAAVLRNEMDNILPGLKDQHQNFYNRLIDHYQQFEIRIDEP